MLIDWFTVGAQVLNFLILVWLMKRYLYHPVLNAIDAREKSIAAELADADAKKSEAQRQSDEFQQRNDEFEQQRVALMKKATDEANTERQRLIEEARQAADTLSARRRETLENDARKLNQSIVRRTQQEVFAIARKTLTDLSGAGLEERSCEAFLQRLREMDAGVKAELTTSLNASSESALIRSAFDLPEDQRLRIQKALNETFSTDIPLRYETAPDLISGIEFTTNGRKIAWSISDYLASLEKGVAELLIQPAKASP